MILFKEPTLYKSLLVATGLTSFKAWGETTRYGEISKIFRYPQAAQRLFLAFPEREALAEMS